jgi:photosystem II stability/assembly factor-like uncharacterized protein
MAIAPPPERLAAQEELDALIREARDRQRRRRLLTAAVVLLAIGLGLGLWAAVPGGGTVAARDHAPITGTAGHVSNTPEVRRGIGDVGSAGGITWAINGHGIWLTTDAGRTWRRSVPRDIAAAGIAVASPPEIQFVNKRDGWMSAPLAFDRRELSKGVHHFEFDRTTDGGRTWHVSTPPGCRRVCYDGSLSFLDARHGYLFAAVHGRANKLFRTSDGGRTWQLISRPSIWEPITFVNRRVAFAGGPGQTIIGVYRGPPIISLYRTTDGGLSWSKYNIAGSDSFVELPIRVFGSQVVLVQNGPNRGGGLNLAAGTIDVSPDGGRDWVAHPVPSGLGVPTSFSAVSPSVWAFSSQSDLFTTHDAGRHWRKIAVPNLPRYGEISQVVFTSSKVGWALFPRLGLEPTLFRTTDGGLHWTPAGPLKPRHSKPTKR